MCNPPFFAKSYEEMSESDSFEVLSKEINERFIPSPSNTSEKIGL